MKGGNKMIKVIYIKTGEEETFETLEDAKMYIKVFVMVTNDRIQMGLEKGKRINKNHFIISE